MEQYSGGSSRTMTQMAGTTIDEPDIAAIRKQPDALTGAGHCGDKNTGGIAGRCGYGPRLPLLMISPFRKVKLRGQYG